MQVVISGEDVNEMAARARANLSGTERERFLDTTDEPSVDKSKEPITILLLILALDKGIDVAKDIIEERRRRGTHATYEISIDGRRPEPIGEEELLRRLDDSKRPV
jgi:hypothetical protein